jgi:hypothetical protein
MTTKTKTRQDPRLLAAAMLILSADAPRTRSKGREKEKYEESRSFPIQHRLDRPDLQQHGSNLVYPVVRRPAYLKLHVLEDADDDDYDRDDRIRLIRRTIIVLKEGIGSLTATKGSDCFEFWVECEVLRALPPHQWASEDGGLLHPEDFERLDCEEFGLAPMSLTPHRFRLLWEHYVESKLLQDSRPVLPSRHARQRPHRPPHRR